MPRSTSGSPITSGSHFRYRRQSWRRSNKAAGTTVAMMARVDVGEAQSLQLQQRLQQNGILIRRARCLGYRAPLGADFLAVVHGENDVGVAGVDGEKHGEPYAKNTSPAGIARMRPCAFAQDQSAAFVYSFEHAGRLLVRQAAPGCARQALPRAPARRRGSQKTLRRARPHTIWRSGPRGGAAHHRRLEPA